jgi:hypothetical protein
VAGFNIPWMYVGMLLLGLPAMLAAPATSRRRLHQYWLALLSAFGMVIGMGCGAKLVLLWAGPMHPHQFLLALCGMTIGMTAGMLVCCKRSGVSQ